jgi:5-methyltetrahydropteroyltriglutamate--homocysteine methyltransferase
MCAALSSRRDPSDELDLAVDLMNKTVQGISGVKLGVHVWRGNWSKREDVLLKGDYAPLLPYLISMKIDQLVLEFATPRAGEMKVFSEYKNEKEMGLGVVNPRTDNVESPEAVTKKVKTALEYFDTNMVYLNPDCGFGTFAERSVNSPQVAYEKLKAISSAAETLRRDYA